MDTQSALAEFGVCPVCAGRRATPCGEWDAARERARRRAAMAEKYELIEKVGEGNFGEVRIASHVMRASRRLALAPSG